MSDFEAVANVCVDKYFSEALCIARRPCLRRCVNDWMSILMNFYRLYRTRQEGNADVRGYVAV